MNVMEETVRTDLFEEMTAHLLSDEKPSDYITSLSNDPALTVYPFQMLWKLKDTEQSKKYHPEGSVWNHTMLVLDEAAKVRSQSRDTETFMWAALLHDIGKPETTRMRKGKITSYDHDRVGEKLSADFLHALTKQQELIEKVSAMVRYHMHMLYVLNELPYADVENILQRTDIWEIALLCRCDRLGRTGADTEAEEKEYHDFLARLQSFRMDGHMGK
jgi:putative nucleotidyltransferase with HDIG domain